MQAPIKSDGNGHIVIPKGWVPIVALALGGIGATAKWGMESYADARHDGQVQQIEEVRATNEKQDETLKEYGEAINGLRQQGAVVNTELKNMNHWMQRFDTKMDRLLKRGVE